MLKKQKIIVSVTNDLTTDQRVDKVCNTLTDNGFEVKLIGRRLKGSLPLNRRNYILKRFNLPFNKGFLFYTFYNVYLFLNLLFTKFDILLSNDLDTLPANYLIARIKRKKLVYDSHEYFTEVPELVNRPFVKKFWTTIESKILPNIKFAYTVNNSISNIYKAKYNLDMKVIRNVPKTNGTVELLEIERPKNKSLIIYQGSVNLGRGLEQMINAMPLLLNCEFWIIGGGDKLNSLKLLVHQLKLNEQVKFIGKIPFNQLKNYTVLADIGISLEEKLGKNYEFALPNKVFDYIHSGIPILSSKLIEIEKVFYKYEIGCFIENHSPEEIANKVNYMLSNNVKLDLWKANLEQAKNEFCWETEEREIIELFKSLN